MFNIISLFVTIGFGIFGIYEWRQRKKLNEINKQNAWTLYRDASVLFGGLQRLQKIQSKDDFNLELGKLVSHAENLMNNQIKQINIEEHITSEKIEKWYKEGKICDETHKDVFNKFA